MAEVVLPQKIRRTAHKKSDRICAGHRAWVRRHYCSVGSCRRKPIECAHVRSGTDAGMGLKPSDRWAISLCAYHHREQHTVGERAFGEKYSLDLVRLATEFARRSPFWRKLLLM
jgi:hypothetical protein